MVVGLMAFLSISKKTEHKRRDILRFNDMLFDVESDPKQQYDIKDDAIIKKMEDALREKLKEVGAPIEQFDRLGLN